MPTYETYPHKHVTQGEADAIRRWADQKGKPVRGPHGLPLSTISAYALELSLGVMWAAYYPMYGPGEEMTPRLVLARTRARWEAEGSSRPIRPVDIARLAAESQ